MERDQIRITGLLALVSAFGMFGLCRMIIVGKDRYAWSALAVMFVLAWVARRSMLRMPVAAEASMRAKNAPAWSEMSPSRRRLLFWIDWPLYSTLRNRESERLFDEPLTSITFDRDEITIRPIEATHRTPFFLKRIAAATEAYGLKVANVKQGIFGPTLNSPEVRLVPTNDDHRIVDHLRHVIGKRNAVALNIVVQAIEDGYVGGLSDEEQSRFYRERR